MPLSKKRDRERKRQSRLDKRVVRPPVQPNLDSPMLMGNWTQPKQWTDADGNLVYDD